MTPIFLLLINHPDWLPDWLSFIQINDAVHVPIYLQMMMLELMIDGLKLASVNTPSMLSTPLSVVAGIILGDYTVSSGWFNSEIMLYMAFVAVANYTQVSLELGVCAEIYENNPADTDRCVRTVGNDWRNGLCRTFCYREK